MPLEIEYVNGMPAMIMNVGKPSSTSFHLTMTASPIMRKPTNTSAPHVAAELMQEISGERNAARMNRMPVKTEVRPVRPPSAAPDADSTNVVMDEAPMMPPTAAAAESTMRIGLISSTLPSSVKNSPCLATAMAVPMVSKKSLIMSEKANSRIVGVEMAFTRPITPSESLMNGAPNVEKSNGATRPVGIWVTPSGMPQTAAITMPHSSAPLTFMEYSTTVTTMEMTPTRNVGSVTLPRDTSVSALARMMPPSLRPIIAMNRPRPMEMPRRSDTGMASMMASRRPQSTSSRMAMPSMRTTAMAVCQPRPIEPQSV